MYIQMVRWAWSNAGSTASPLMGHSRAQQPPGHLISYRRLCC